MQVSNAVTVNDAGYSGTYEISCGVVYKCKCGYTNVYVTNGAATRSPITMNTIITKMSIVDHVQLLCDYTLINSIKFYL